MSTPYWHIETDIFALAVFFALLYKAHKRGRKDFFHNRAFTLMMLVSIFSTLVDIVSSAAMNSTSSWWFYEITMVLYALTVPIMAFMWIVYTLLLIFPDDVKRAKRDIIIAFIPYVVYIFICLSNPITSWMFSLSPALEYARGPLFFIFGVGENMFYSLLGLVLLIVYHRRISSQYNMVLLAVYYLITASSLWVQLAVPGWLIIYATYAVVFIFCDATIEENRRWQVIEEIREQNKTLEGAVREYSMASHAKTAFLARLSHDLRTPVNGILGIATLAHDNNNPPDTEESLKKIETSCDFLLGFMNDTLDVTKLESGTIELHPEPYPFAQFCEYADAIIEPMCRQKGIEFVRDYQNIPNVAYAPEMDKLRINQVIFNLLSNAVRYTPKGGCVTLRIHTERPDPAHLTLLLTVEDNGVGISKEAQQHLFDTMDNGNDMIGSQQESGLGLVIVGEMLKLMNGTVTVESEPGKGAAFHVKATFPLVKIGSVHSTEALVNRAMASIADKTILLAEDHPLNREITVRLLKKAGVNVLVAEDGQQALQTFEKSEMGSISAILMDIRMPVLDGLDATRAIRALPRADAVSVPVIAMTANAFTGDQDECIAAGMDGYLAKPIITSQLYDTLSHFIRRK